MWYLKLRTFITSLLKDESGANAVEYAITMVFAAVFIIGGLLSMSTGLKKPLTDMAVCLADVDNCINVTGGGGDDGTAGDIGGEGGEGGEGG